MITQYKIDTAKSILGQESAKSSPCRHAAGKCIAHAIDLDGTWTTMDGTTQSKINPHSLSFARLGRVGRLFALTVLIAHALPCIIHIPSTCPPLPSLYFPFFF